MTHDRDIKLVRELHPAAEQPSGSDAAPARERARGALMAEIERVDTPPPRGSFFHAPLRRQRRLAGIVALAVALAVAVAVPLSLRGGAANPTSAAAAVLQRAAHAAAASGGPRQLRPGEYWYVKSYETVAGAIVAAPPSVLGRLRVIADALQTTERQVWIGVDTPGLVVTRITRPITFLSAAARKQWVRYGRPRQLTPVGRISLPPGTFIRPYRQLLALPSNVDALSRVIEHGAGKGSPRWKRHEMFTEIGDLLREDPIPAKVRAALYLVAARIPGIQMLGLTHDGIGRPALAVSLNDSLYGMREELLFDPHTSALLGESSVVVNPPPAFHVKPGSVRTGSTYVDSGIVERIGQVPGR
jgi:hypothetical protein